MNVVNCDYSVELSGQGDSNEYQQHTFLWRTNENYQLDITRYGLRQTKTTDKISELTYLQIYQICHFFHKKV